MHVMHRREHFFKFSDIIIYSAFLLAPGLFFVWEEWLGYLSLQGRFALTALVVITVLAIGKNTLIRSYGIWVYHRKLRQFERLVHLNPAERYVLANWVFSGYSDYTWSFEDKPFRQKQKLVAMLQKFEQLGYITHLHYYHIRGCSTLLSCGFSLYDNNNLKLRKSLNEYRSLQ